MRVSRLSALVAGLATITAASLLPECYTIDLLSETTPKTENLGDSVQGHLITPTSICYRPKHFHTNLEAQVNTTHFIEYSGPIAIRISSTHGDIPTTKRCISNFKAIVDGCTGQVNFAGGSIHDDNIEYSLYLRSEHTESKEEHTLEARARGGSKTRTKTKPKPKSQPKAKHKKKSKTGSKSKSKSKKSKSKSKSKLKSGSRSKPKSKSPYKSTPTQNPTATQTTIKIGPTKNCKQLALFMQKPSTRGRTARDLEKPDESFVEAGVALGFKEDLLKRADNNDENIEAEPGSESEDDGEIDESGNNVRQNNWDFPSAEDIEDNNEAKTPKKGSACGVSFPALDYPSKSSMPRNAPYYSIDSDTGLCEAINFQETSTNYLGPGKYHIEHILEWQTVTHFFDWMNRKMGENYVNPDPVRMSKTISFCDYWKAHWNAGYQQEVEINGLSLKPMMHMAQAYPGLRNRPEEFVWLQASLNTPAKANMWRYKGNKDNSGTLFDRVKMRRHILGKRMAKKDKPKRPEDAAAEVVDLAKVALIKLKSLLGARKYMRARKVSDIFKKQMESIGEMLDAIETELANNPRQGRKTYHPWVKQDLQKEWTIYMNERFQIAKTRTHNDMDTYLELFKETWCSGRPKSKPGSPAGSRAGSPKPGARAGSSKAGSSKAGSSKAGLRSRSSRPGLRSGSRAGSADPGNELSDLFGEMNINDLMTAMNPKDVAIVDLCRFHGNLEKEWIKEKRVPWEAPW